MKKLELIVFHDELGKISSEITKKSVLNLMNELDIDYELIFSFEADLYDKQKIPDNSILYVHGNEGRRYTNLKLVRELIQRRPDLKFVLQMGKRYGVSEFFNIGDYEFVKQAHEAGFNAANQVVVSTEYPTDFFRGADSWGGKIEDSFRKYMLQYIESGKEK